MNKTLLLVIGIGLTAAFGVYSRYSSKELILDWGPIVEGERCEVHDVELELDVVPFKNTMAPPIDIFDDAADPNRVDRYFEAEGNIFPNDNSYADGGCGPRLDAKAKVQFCAVCRVAYEEWWGEHGDA